MTVQTPMTGNAKQSFVVHPGPVDISYSDHGVRFSLRFDPAQISAMSNAIGLALPDAIGKRTIEGSKEALCLGPDEWVLILSPEDKPAVVAALKALYASVPHSLVETGDRDVSFTLKGDQSLVLLQAVCPRDVSVLAPGTVRRTVMDGHGVILTVLNEGEYRVDIWRSYGPHLWMLFHQINAELATGL